MRNKLIELLAEASLNSANRCSNTDCDECRENAENGGACFRGFEADHLLANGVTVQQWIPVSERLPVPYETVLVVVHEKYNHEKNIGIHTDVGYYRGDHEGSIDRE